MPGRTAIQQPVRPHRAPASASADTGRLLHLLPAHSSLAGKRGRGGRGGGPAPTGTRASCLAALGCALHLCLPPAQRCKAAHSHGALQFLYMLLVGSFPFNAFLAGFFCSLSAFVLTGAAATTSSASCVAAGWAPLEAGPPAWDAVGCAGRSLKRWPLTLQQEGAASAWVAPGSVGPAGQHWL